MLPLPVEPSLPALGRALATGTSAVLQAPPGAGKTTRVPLALLASPWLTGLRIVMLEPRRLAARAAARRMSETLGESVGGTVGYRIRREVRVGPASRIEVVTEGILTRMIQSDPALESVGLVIFDEFHERSLHADLGLALTLQTRSVLRPDLRVLVMSATIEGGPVAELLGAAPVITSEGRQYPVETRYLPRRPGSRFEADVAGAVRRALEETEGDLLVFLPGAGEIRRVQDLLSGDPSRTEVLPLHGSLGQEQQDRALRPAPPNRRKVILATSIAETSLTIEGIGVVIDGGLARVPRFSPRTGMTRLETVRVTRASADQRRGRAGRLGPGICYRLWAAAEDHQLLARNTPEILEADLAALALELTAAGIRDPAQLAWLDPPPVAAYGEALKLLETLDAVVPSGAGGLAITDHGRTMCGLGVHPRLAHLLIRAGSMGQLGLASEIAALLGERDLLRSEQGPPDPDIRLRLDLLHGDATGSVNRDAIRRIRAEAVLLQREAGAGAGVKIADPADAGVLLALAYPDRIAQRRPGQAGRFLLRNGQGAALEAPSLALSDYLVAAELDGQKRESRILLAAPITSDEIRADFAQQIVREDVVQWDQTAGAVTARRRERLGALILSDAPWSQPDPALIKKTMVEWLGGQGLEVLPWTDEARQLVQRLRFLRGIEPGGWPDLSDEGLLAALLPGLDGIRRRDDLRCLNLVEILLTSLTWRQRNRLAELAPTHLTVPSGSRVAIDYRDVQAPVLAVRLQEVFGWTETPRVAGGAVPLTLHLLSPAHRPVQVTRDLEGFWRNTYFEVRKDLKGRYPKHYWPDDPLTAEPTRRAKPRR